MENNAQTKKTSMLSAILLTFIASCGIYLYYMHKYIELHSESMNKITNLLSEIGVPQNKHSALLMIFYVFVFFIMWIFSVILNKIVLHICSIDLKSDKLLITIGTSYIISFLLSTLIIEIIPENIIRISMGILEIIIFTYMCSEEIKPQIKRFMLCKIILLVINLLPMFFMK